jgi:hypothetical protein
MDEFKKYTEITQDNWNFCHYKALNLKAFISFGGDLTNEFYYLVTCTDPEDNREFFQKKVHSLEDAVREINHLYGKFELIDLRSPNEEGCSSCEAH